MKCPYCAKETSDQSIVCPFCQRDIAVFRSISQELTNLEKTFNTTLDAGGRRSESFAVALTLAFPLSLFLSTFFQWASWQWFATINGIDLDWLWHFLSGASPFLA